MNLVKAKVQYNEGWWVADFSVDDKQYGTQARTLDELEPMVRDAANLMTGIPADNFTVDFEPAHSAIS
ncbi:MAG: hypothetical protein Q4D87_02510 [Actinomycetaceae bacterium]|nr:hypothetical protein [Actinomycetaceae bacterium]